MRIRSFFLAVPLGLMPVLVAAQTPPPAAPAAGTPATASKPAAADADEDALPTTFGVLDFGARTTSLTGDGARYERYRDLSDGLFLETGRLYSEKNGWVYGLAVDHLGRRDQRYEGSAVRPGLFKVWGQWDQIPMLMSRSTRTLFNFTSPGVLEIDNAIQTSVQASAANLANFIGGARVFDLSSRRHIFDFGAQYIGHYGLTIDTNIRRMNREGGIPFGGSFGHGNVVETIAPVNHNLTDVDSSAEFVHGNFLARAGYTGSFFHNNYTSLTFDNPWRVTDISTAGSRGRAALSPSNSFVGVNGTLSYRLPAHSRATVYASMGTLKDAGDPLLPFTVNAALVSPALYRSTVNGRAETSSVNLSFVSRPTTMIDFDVRFRTYDYDNKTPEFIVGQRVAYDNAISTNSPVKDTEPFGVKRESFDADMRFTPVSFVSAGLGFTHQKEERTHRIFEAVEDNTVRLVVDSTSSKKFTLRSKYERTTRRGEGTVAAITAELSAVGEQPGMRHFDIASRNRNRVTWTAMFVPIDMLALNASFAAGKDDYLQSEFGLRDNNHKVYSAGFDVNPNEWVSTGLSYSRERYTSLSRSRQANPGVQFTDASRNWAADTADSANSVIAHLELLKVIPHLDVSLTGDYNRARGLYQYITGAVTDRTLPEEVVVPTTLPAPTQLPLVKSDLGRANLDLVYELSDKWGLGASVWYERYRVKDFALDSDALSRLDPAGALLLGYQYLPYTATTFSVRAVYKF